MDKMFLSASPAASLYATGNSQGQTWLDRYTYRAEEVRKAMVDQEQRAFMLEHVPALLGMTATR